MSGKGKRASRIAACALVIALGALMIADGVLGWVTGEYVIFAGVDPTFKFAVGFIVIVLGASLLGRFEKQP